MSGVRNENEDHLAPAFFCFVLTSCFLLLSADCLLHSGEAGRRGLLAGMGSLDKMSVPTGKERASNFKK